MVYSGLMRSTLDYGWRVPDHGSILTEVRCHRERRGGGKIQNADLIFISWPMSISTRSERLRLFCFLGLYREEDKGCLKGSGHNDYKKAAIAMKEPHLLTYLWSLLGLLTLSEGRNQSGLITNYTFCSILNYL